MQGRSVDLQDLSVRFEHSQAVEPMSLAIAAGEFFSILGPSGCGKTTLLRVVSGFQAPTTGRVLIGGKDVTPLGPSRRPTAMIFQSLALFPQMSIRDNVAFGLEARGVSRRDRHQRADALLEVVALSEHAAKRPSQLSGGQRQRVAIARALAVEPAVLLLDEPLSALDLKLRQHMRAELRGLQKRTGVTFIYITHDQGEALAMSDRVAVMSRGRIEQIGAPRTLYNDPETPFVASFLGEQNRLAGRIVALADGVARIETPLGVLAGSARPGLSLGANAELMVRPERIRIGTGPASDGKNVNLLQGQVVETVLEGAIETLQAVVGEVTLAVHRVPKPAAEVSGLQPIAFDAADALVFPRADAFRTGVSSQTDVDAGAASP